MPKRATQAEIDERRQAILAFCEEHQPVTVRGIYYHLTTLGLVPKTDAGYQKVARDCKKLRMQGELPWSYIADNTRWSRKPRTFDSLRDALDNTAATYRRDLLNHLQLDIEIWLEKDALSGVFYPVTAEFDIPLMVSRGFASLTFLHAAAASLQDGAFVYVFSDYDYSGEVIEQKIREGLREFSGGKTIHIERAMLTRHQISDWELPTREPKSNDRKHGYEHCAELDAVPPNQLRNAVRDCITDHISPRMLENLRDIENQERASIEKIFNFRLADRYY